MKELNDFVEYHDELWILIWLIVTSARLYMELGM